MKRALAISLFVVCCNLVYSQPISRPKLVVGIVVDQMRWDYLYRFYDRYSDDGFKRFLTKGFSCENTFIPYAPTVTACGHASIYTGSVPALNGITGNIWYDNDFNESVYCTQDQNAKTIGSTSDAGTQSPRNLWTSTIGDELKLATNFRAKVFGVALKDRGSILPAGHAADAAYWFDYSVGKWITSDYYMSSLPDWAKNFPSVKMINDYYKEGWNTLYPIKSYVQSTGDVQSYEGRPFGSAAQGFPYKLDSFADKNFSTVLSTPFGNSLTFDFAKQLIENEKMGADSITDLIAISFSSPDYIGHAFGPNSVEEEDNYLRLDRTLADLFAFLDKTVGKDQYITFLSADHAVAHVPAFALSKKIPAGNLNVSGVLDSLNNALKAKFGRDKMVIAMPNYQVTFDKTVVAGTDFGEIKKFTIAYLQKTNGIDRVVDLENINAVALPAKLQMMFTNGYNPHRGGQLQMIFDPQWLEGFTGGGTTHGVWNPYDSHIPLLWTGWGIKPGKTNREVYMTDIAPTISALLHIQMPNGCIGKVITELTN